MALGVKFAKTPRSKRTSPPKSLHGSRARAGALDIENPAVREATLKAKVQVVDISTLQSRDGMNHSRFIALAELYPRLQRQPARGKSGIFVIDANSATVARPLEVGSQAAVH
jgi:esterase/lipase superfamily enzyme